MEALHSNLKEKLKLKIKICFYPSQVIKFSQNPYGADLMLAELIPSTMITNKDGNASLFRAGTTNENGDLVTFLTSGEWKQFWYNQSHGNVAVTKVHNVGVRRPLTAADANATSMDGDDFFIGNGSVASMVRCNANGDANATGLYTKLTLASIPSASLGKLKGFDITFTGLEGYLLHEDGVQEINATDNTIQT